MPTIISSTPSASPDRPTPGFSLIELIIVILIASLLAGVIFNNVSFRTHAQTKVGLHQLKEIPKEYPEGEGDLVCTDACRHCRIMHEGQVSELPSQLKPLKAYLLDDGNTPQEIDFGRMKDKKVCLRFHFYANGSTSQMILESEGIFYFVPSYFGEIQAYDTLGEAVDRWRQYRDQLDSMGAFF
jgi:prepilin-type N-terminal cleavage/methylation domain-containing protein